MSLSLIGVSPSDDLVCNESETHVVTEGQNITYSCAFSYQGVILPGATKWEGEGLNETLSDNRTWPRQPVDAALTGTSYTGE